MVARALDAFVGAGSWDGTGAILQREQKLLLSQTAQALLIQRLAAARRAKDEVGVRVLELYLRLLLEARASGDVTASWAAFASTRAAVEQLLAASWYEKRGVLEREQEALLADQALLLLAWREAVARRGQGDQDASNTRILSLHRAILLRARLLGAVAAWAEYDVFRQASERILHDGLRSSALGQTLPAWLDKPTDRGGRRFLETNPGLLAPESDTLIMGLIFQTAGQGELEDHLRDSLLLLRDVRARGKPLASAIQDAYVNACGGLSLDVPNWLDEAERRLTELRRAGRPEQTATEYGALLRGAIVQAENDRAVTPEVVAELHLMLARSYLNVLAPTVEKLDEALVHDEAAQRTYTRVRFPVQHALVQLGKGNALTRRVEQTAGPEGVRLLQQAVAAYDAALAVLDPTTYAVPYVAVQLGKGNALTRRVERTAGLEGVRLLQQAVAAYDAALAVLDPTTNELDYYASVQNSKGIALRVLGERTAGPAGLQLLQRAVAAYDAAVAVLDPTTYAVTYARVQLGKGNALTRRGERTAGPAGLHLLQQAVAAYDAALAVLDPTMNAPDYTRVQYGKGNALIIWEERTAGPAGLHLLQQAVAAYDAALAVLDPTTYSLDYAGVQNGKGIALLSQGKRTAGTAGLALLQQAVAAYDAALAVLDPTTNAITYAGAQNGKGNALAGQGERTAGTAGLHLLQQAVAAYDAALAVFTLEGNPSDYLKTQLNKAGLAVRALAAEARNRGDWEALRRAHQLADAAYTAARRAQAELSWLESDAAGKASLRGQHAIVREMYTNHAWCLVQLGELQRAAVALEVGRAQALAEAQSIAGAALEDLSPEERALFETVRERLEDARLVGRPAEVRAAHAAFLDARQHIRGVDKEHPKHPDFLPDEPEWGDVAEAARGEQALMYLAATDFGGLVLVLPPSHGDANAARREPVLLELPKLTWTLVDDWLVRLDAKREVVGGWRYAIGHNAVSVLESWLTGVQEAQGEAAKQQLTQLRLTEVPKALPSTMHTLKAALERTLRAWRTEAKANAKGDREQHEEARRLEVRLRLRLGEALRLPALESQLGWFYTEVELDELLPQLSRVVIQPLREQLDALGLGDLDQPVALVACGRLGALPLHAAMVRSSGRRQMVPFQETCELSYQAGARSLRTAHDAAEVLPRLGPFLTVGDPPTGLPWLDRLPRARDEAEEIAHLAKVAKREGSQALLGEKATLAALVGRRGPDGELVSPGLLREVRTTYRGAWVDIASHGSADPTDPAKCYMLLAHGDRLTLSYLQSESILQGVRCFIASGCVTSVGDLEMAPDELSSFTAGALQAGAASTLATQWSVRDRANYLLMLRTAQEALAHPDWRPTRALREAARWLRTARARDLGAFEDKVHQELERQRGVQGQLDGDGTGQAQGRRLDAASDGDRGGEREALRGVPTHEESASVQVDTSKPEQAGGPVEALRAAGAPHAARQQGKYPYAHPICWAAVVAYGA